MRLINDKDMMTGITIDQSEAGQFIEINWSAYGTPTAFTVRGVLFHTDEALMTAGTVEFFVDGTVCPDTSGVGINGIGGVFNCDLVGEKFTAVCTATCTPKFAVREL